MRRFLIQGDQVRSGRARLVGPEAHHARHVLRLKTGDSLILIDGQGSEYMARIVSSGPEGLDLEILDRQPALQESPLELTLGLALLKADRMDLVVQKGTELGLKTLTPVRAARCAVQLSPDRAAKRLERWRRVAGEAVKQCRRGEPVQVNPLTELPGFLSASAGAELKVMLYEGAAGGEAGDWRALLNITPRPRSVTALIGPEGGFTEAEVTLARKTGFDILGLGPRILRSETAALALMAILGFELGDLVSACP